MHLNAAPIVGWHFCVLQNCKKTCHRVVRLDRYNQNQRNRERVKDVKDFKELAGKYLAFNKKRTVLTILGVALSAMILFVLINTIMSLYVTGRNETRDKVKYEAVFLCDSETKTKELSAESCIKDFETERGAEGEWAVYVNFEQPYLMKGHIDKLVEKYSVECEATLLGAYYYAEEGAPLLVLALVALLVSYIFAVFGVAVVRNSIQLITLEQIRDYGMLRCMGSTKRQLKEMVFAMGFALEISGIVIGIVLGFLIYLPIAVKAELAIGFHAIAVVFIVVAFMFDLYFVMQENCKFVNKLAPIEAVRGEFKIKTEKIKARRKSFAGVLFGIEGDYASKNLKRNPSRMWKSVGAMSMGIAMVIVAVSICSILYSYATRGSSQYGEYQLADVAAWQPGLEQQINQLIFLPQENVDMINASEQVTVSKDVYEARLYTVDFMETLNHYTREFLYEADYGRLQRSCLTAYERYKEENQVYRKSYEQMLAENSLVGYDESDYANLESALVEGTLDLSENGILLVNGTCTMVDNPELLGGVWQKFAMTDYKVGDTIEYVDYKKLDVWIKEHMKGQETTKEDGTLDYELLHNAFYEGYLEMIEQGATRTYVIEGILEKDTNRAIIYEGPRFILPLERFLEETGLAKENTAGKMYHIKGHSLDDSLKKVLEKMSGEYAYEQYWYLETLEMSGTIWNVVIGASLFVLFVVVVNMLNIVNTTASDLHLRRKEFAQLRVLGMSKKKLTFTVLLEGLITAFLAGIIGVGLGYLIVELAMDAIKYAFYVEFSFSWGLSLLLVLVSTMILCLTVYLPIHGMKFNMAEELQASGE